MQALRGGGGDAGVAEMWGIEAAAEERCAHCVIVSDWPSEAHAPAARFVGFASFGRSRLVCG
jgi:hypothetical protein